jgi:hypothetical protein
MKGTEYCTLQPKALLINRGFPREKKAMCSIRS